MANREWELPEVTLPLTDDQFGEYNYMKILLIVDIRVDYNPKLVNLP